MVSFWSVIRGEGRGGKFEILVTKNDMGGWSLKKADFLVPSFLNSLIGTVIQSQIIIS